LKISILLKRPKGPLRGLQIIISNQDIFLNCGLILNLDLNKPQNNIAT
jgi:hypothetical protein